MPRIFEYVNYKEYINDYKKSLPKNGRGFFQKLSQAINIHTTLTSQIFNGDRDLSMEQAYQLSSYLEHDHRERKFLITMVMYAKAGHYELKNFHKNELSELKRQADELETRLSVKSKLNQKASSIYYSNPIYSKIRMMTSIESLGTVDAIANATNLIQVKVQEILDFLYEYGLVIIKDGKYRPGPTRTHIPANSPFVLSHHKNWRLQALDKQVKKDEVDLFYTGPMSMDEETFEEVKEIFRSGLEKVYEKVKKTDAKNVYCVNFDCFKVL